MSDFQSGLLRDYLFDSSSCDIASASPNLLSCDVIAFFTAVVFLADITKFSDFEVIASITSTTKFTI